MGTQRPRSVVLDAGALIAFERSDGRVRALVELAALHGARLHIPAAVIAQVWRDGRKQARLARLLSSSIVQVCTLDLEEAQGAGVLCGVSGTKDVVDASIVLLARRENAVVVTSDIGDLRRIDPAIDVVKC